MKIITAVLSGLALPQSVTSFSTSERPNVNIAFRTKTTTSTPASASTTRLHVASTTSAATSESSIATAAVTAIETPTKPQTTRKPKRKKAKRKPNEDINFLVKRTNQIISHASLSNTDSDAQGDATGSVSGTEAVSDSGTGTDTSSKKEQKEKQVSHKTFHWLMDAWTTSLHRTAPEHSLALMNSMKDYGLAPMSKTLTKVLSAYAKCGRGGAATKQVLDAILEENANAIGDFTSSVYSYTAVLEAYANADVVNVEDANEANELLEFMIQETRNGNKSMKPNAKSFLAVIRTWGAVNEGELGATEATNWIKQMNTLLEEEVIHVEDAPNVFHYNAILNAWANCGEKDAAERTDALLSQMEDEVDVSPSPNSISYNVCIDAYAKMGNGDRAEDLLNRMDELYQTRKNSGCRPNTRSYNSVMNAYAKSLEQNTASKAEKFLRKMESLYKESDGVDRHIKPDYVSYATVINAWGRSFEYNKAKKVLQIYNEMMTLFKEGDLSLRPNVVIFNSIINACAYTIGDPIEQRQAMETATFMLRELEASTHAKADQITYGTFLKTCQTQMPQSDTRRQLVGVVFRKCAKDGQVGQLVLDQLRSINTRSEYDELLGDSANIVNWRQLPANWKRNVVEGKRYRRQKLL